MNQENVGKFIAECRKSKKLTQEQLAEKIGVSRKSISRWENGNSMPDYSILDILCNTLDVSINELYYGKKMEKEDYKNISEENLKLYIREKYSKQILIKRTIRGIIIGILVFIVVYLIMNI
ncbi:MAG: helix-turn-helix domain-containing protein [Bacilli bacterium]